MPYKFNPFTGNLDETFLTRNEILSLSGGIYSGGLVEINSDPTKINIYAGKGVIVDDWTNPEAPIPVDVEWPDMIGVGVTYRITSTFSVIAIDINSQVVQFNTYPTPSEKRVVITLVALAHTGLTVINNVNPYYSVMPSPISQFRDFQDEIGVINSGNVISANGANLLINKSFGSIHGRGFGYLINPKEPNDVPIAAQVGATFQYRTQTGVATGNVTSIDVNNYDLNGTVTAIGGGSNSSTNQRVYLFPNGNIRIQYGQTVYSTLEGATAAIPRESFSTFQNIAVFGILIGVISVKHGSTALNSSTQAVFTPASKFGELFVGASSSGNSTTTLQQAYDNSVTPEIITNSTLGAFSLKRGSAADTDNVIEIYNSAGTLTFRVRGDGAVYANNISGNSGKITSTVNNTPFI